MGENTGFALVNNSIHENQNGAIFLNGEISNCLLYTSVLAGVLPVLKAQGVYLAAQCCEHLNRAIVIEQEAAEKLSLIHICTALMPEP